MVQHAIEGEAGITAYCSHQRHRGHCPRRQRARVSVVVVVGDSSRSVARSGYAPPVSPRFPPGWPQSLGACTKLRVGYGMNEVSRDCGIQQSRGPRTFEKAFAWHLAPISPVTNKRSGTRPPPRGRGPRHTVPAAISYPVSREEPGRHIPRTTKRWSSAGSVKHDEGC